jgi:hypothetical protein
MDLQLTIAQQGSQSGYAIFNIYDPTALDTVIDSKNVALPIFNTVVVDFTNQANMTYVVRTFLSPTTDFHDGTQIGSDFYAYPGLVNSAVIKDDLWIKAGTTPGFAVGGNSYVDSNLAGWNYWVDLVGVKALHVGVDIQLLSGGGWQYINGYVIQPDEEYVMHFQPQVTSSGGGSGGGSTNPAGKLFSGFNVLTVDTILTNLDMGKIQLVQSATDKITIILPAIGTVPDNQITKFISDGGSHIMATLSSAANIQFLNSSRQNIYLGQGESLEIFKNGSQWYVYTYSDGFKNVGEFIESQSLGELNTLLGDGSLLDGTVYPRLYEYIQTKLDSSLVVTMAQWVEFTNDPINNRIDYPNIGKWAIELSTQTFRVPLLIKAIDENGNIIAPGFTRGVGTPNAPFTGETTDSTIGENKADAVGNFFANIPGKQGMLNYSPGGGSAVLLGVGTYGPVTNTNVLAALSGQSWNGSAYVNNGETRPGAIGIYKLIRF